MKPHSLYQNCRVKHKASQEKAFTKSQAIVDIPELTAVKLICHQWQQIAALPHVRSSINSFLDCFEIKWTLERASNRGAVKMMDRLGKLEWSEASDGFRKKRFLTAVKKAICDAKPQSLRWWMMTYMPDHAFAIPEIQKLAIEQQCGYTAKLRVEMLQWLLDQGKLTNCEF